ncbi:MAG TPA: ribosome biogenesis GTP-binding protein YihA/YsxC [Candidatus Limnocylindrales bacterium]|nr:ribosome biogenesis GTP-binding protein YihA/YsxC [Candidatus Limnocylindrales bacterium]
MKITRAEFRAAATSVASIPPARHPEIALAGRSNVGKSSLLNRLTNRSSLARTSRTPGCTRGLLFYDVNDAITLVDLPGYGYASRSQAERRQWKVLVERYLETREELAGVLILVDSRRGPEQEESELAEYLQEVGLPFAFVLTKADKLTRSALARQTAAVSKAMAPAVVLATSSQSGAGIDGVWKWIRAAIAVESELDESDGDSGGGERGGGGERDGGGEDGGEDESGS